MYIFWFKTQTFFPNRIGSKIVRIKTEANELFYLITWIINRRKQTLHTYKKHDN